VLVTSPRSTVLVVEDDAALRNLYRAALAAAGYLVIAVEDGVDALRRLDSLPPDAVVLDLLLPRLGGRDVHREMKSRVATRDIPVVVVSGTDIADLDPAEFACVLRKPIDTDAVVVAVDRSLRAARRNATGA
jgi:CheY-like chemotaxis protein